MRIHGFVYLVVGTAVAIFSKVVGSKNLAVFVYVGILFALFGIFRLVLDSLRRKSKNQVHPSQQPNHFVTRHHKVTKTQNFLIHYCPQCGTPLKPADNFCSRCGRRLQP